MNYIYVFSKFKNQRKIMLLQINRKFTGTNQDTKKYINKHYF